MKAGRGIYDCGHVSLKTTRSARSKNWYKTHGKTKLESEIVITCSVWGKFSSYLVFLARDGFLSLSLVGVQGRLKFLLGFGFIVSFLFYFVCTHWNSACVSIKQVPRGKKFGFPYLLVLSFTLYFCCIPCSSTRVKISSRIICKATYMYD